MNTSRITGKTYLSLAYMSNQSVRMKAAFLRFAGYSLGETLAALKIKNTRGAS